MIFFPGIYGPKGVTVPEPIQSVCTRWGSDPFCSGSYSHIRVGSSGADYDILAESVNDRLFFAGEATNRAYPATMHGALLSGLREASKIHRATESILNSDQKKYSIPKSMRPPNGALEDIFSEPDLAFGRFSFVFSSVTPDDPEALGLARVSLGMLMPPKDHEPKEDQKDQDPAADKIVIETFHLYATVSREQADRLRNSGSDDKSGLGLLCEDLSAKLMGYDSTCDTCSDMISSILSAKKARKRLQRPKNFKISQ
uniref:Amine oxidase domain-containing protein n=1 Tax=Setaria italica TaxID=4555 RepID=K3YJA0_SETIT